MNFYVDSGGVVLHVDPERIFQGSANANTIRFVGAFASNLSVTTAFKLPNGVWTVPQKMTLSAQLPGVQMPDGTQFNTWEYKIPATVTENYGAVNVQFFVYGDTGGTGGQIASAMSSFEVEKGVPITLPDPTDDYNTLLTQILSTLSQLQGFYDGLNTEVEELQTSVRGLQGEVSGIQIDLEQVHTDLGNRVEKTTLTYSLYGTDKNGNQAIIPYGTTGLGNSIPQYTADSEIRIPASPTQSYYAANKGYVDAGLEEKLDKTGGPINGDLLVGGELRVLDDTIIIGNLTVQGTTITEDAETIMSKANVIVTNSEGAPLTQLSGIGIRTNATQVYGIMYDPGDDTVKLGEGTLDANNEFTFNSGEGTAVATRADSAMWTNGHLSMWNAAEYRFVDSGIAADNVVTVNTAQQITGAKTFAQAVRVGTGNVYASYYTGGVIWRDSNGNDHANIFPAGSGTLALTSDIPTDYVTEKEFSNLAQQVEDLYTILEQAQVVTVTTLEQAYTARETADGENIVDGVQTTVKEIRGKTVKTTNLYPYEEYPAQISEITYEKSFFVEGGKDYYFRLFGVVVESPGCRFGFRFFDNEGNNISSRVTIANSDFYYHPNKNVIQLGGDKTSFDYKIIPSESCYVSFGITETEEKVTVRGNLMVSETVSETYFPYFSGLKNVFFKEIVSTGRNLIPYPYADGMSKTTNGITFTVNTDGTVTVNGTATENANFVFFNGSLPFFGTFTLSGCIGGTSDSYYLQPWVDGNWKDEQSDSPTTYNFNGNLTLLTFYVKKGVTLNSVVIKPMLNYGSSALPYESYISDTLSAENPIELAEYDVAYPETGETKRNSGKKVFDGTETWEARGSAGDLYRYGAVLANVKTSGACVANLSGENSGASVAGNYFIDTEFKVFTNIATVDEWKAHLAEIATAGNPLTVIYETAEATTEATPFDKSKYIAWKNGSETIEQGSTDNSEYGAENTVKQDYFTLTGGTTNV